MDELGGTLGIGGTGRADNLSRIGRSFLTGGLRGPPGALETGQADGTGRFARPGGTGRIDRPDGTGGGTGRFGVTGGSIGMAGTGAPRWTSAGIRLDGLGRPGRLGGPDELCGIRRVLEIDGLGGLGRHDDASG